MTSPPLVYPNIPELWPITSTASAAASSARAGALARSIVTIGNGKEEIRGSRRTRSWDAALQLTLRHLWLGE